MYANEPDSIQHNCWNHLGKYVNGLGMHMIKLLK